MIKDTKRNYYDSIRRKNLQEIWINKNNKNFYPKVEFEITNFEKVGVYSFLDNLRDVIVENGLISKQIKDSSKSQEYFEAKNLRKIIKEDYLTPGEIGKILKQKSKEKGSSNYYNLQK